MTDELTISQQLAFLARQADAEWQAVIMWACLFILACVAAYYAAIYAARFLRAYVERFKRNARSGHIIFLAFCVIAILYGGTKPPTPSHLWRFEFYNQLSDDGSYCASNKIYAAWTYNPASADSTVRAYYQDLTVTNAQGVCTDELHALPECLVLSGSHVWDVANATNMRVLVYAVYVPPPAVHTNGVYHLNGVMRPIASDYLSEQPKFVTPGIRILADGETLTPTNALNAYEIPLTTSNPNEETEE